MIYLLIYLVIFWLLIHLLNYFLIDLILKKKTNKQIKTTTKFDLSLYSFHASTRGFNRFPSKLLSFFRLKSKSGGFNQSNSNTSLRLFWDLGTFITLIGLVVAQSILLYAALKSLSALWILLRGNEDKMNGDQVVKVVKKMYKRMIESSPSAASGLVIRPIIPGLTLPLSTLPLLLVALLSAQTFHELGHGLAAASESIPILSTGLHLYVLLPTFYVSLPDSSPSKFSDLRIATAGVWHNLVLVLFILGLSDRGLGIGRVLQRGGFRDVEGGLLVISVEKSSPLSFHLAPYSVITHLNDVELDSSSTPTDLWSSYLSGLTLATSSYENLGWCLPLSDFSSVKTECCLPLSTSDSSSSSSSDTINPRLCFSIPSLTTSTDSSILSACLNPLPYFPPAKGIPPRCLTTSNCEIGKELGCARPVGGEKVLRIGVRDRERMDVDEGERSRTIVWQGNWKGVLEQVSITDVIPRFWFLPISYPRTVERFYSHVVSLSLALAFFNLLPLPHLDGSHILHSFFLCLSSFPDDSVLEAGLSASSSSSLVAIGHLERTLKVMSRNPTLRNLVSHSHAIERGFKFWTVGISTLVLVASLIVESIAIFSLATSLEPTFCLTSREKKFQAYAKQIGARKEMFIGIDINLKPALSSGIINPRILLGEHQE